MNNKKTLQDRCKVVNHKDKDPFVGIRADTNNALVYFPLGYQLSETEDAIRKDILQLITILNEFKDRREGHITERHYEETKEGKFPLNAYMEIILYYMENGYYKEVEPVYKTRERGKINWSKTIKRQRPLISRNSDNTTYSPIYTHFTVKLSTPDEDKEITKIHQYCVRKSFEIIGWIFTSYLPPKAEVAYNQDRFLAILHSKLANTNNDNKKRLFQSMIDIINEMDEDSNYRIHFGTNSFAYIWEGLIEKSFGNKDKEYYYPKGKWKLRYNDDKPTSKLRPDTVMFYDGNFFVIDAKYYRYGDSRDHNHLPSSDSINKQITYGEYVQSLEENNSVYNAFLIPYNSKNNKFESNELFLNIGEAIPEWKYKNLSENEMNEIRYEHIQGILVDIKFLMNNYRSQSTKYIQKLSEAILNAYDENKYIIGDNE